MWVEGGLAAETTPDGELRLQYRELEEYNYPEFRWLTYNINISDPEDDPDLEVYDPLRVEGLHRVFAKTPLEQDAIVAFANRYGFLGRETRNIAHWDKPDTTTVGESFDYWCSRIEEVRVLLWLWDAAKDPSRYEELQNLIVYDDDTAEIDSESLEGLTAPDAIWEGADITHISPDLNERLRYRRMAEAIFEVNLNAALAEGTRPVVSVRKESQVLIVPGDLLAAIYVQMANEVMQGAVAAVPCEGCKRMFAPLRVGQKHCSGACKQKAYRAKVRRNKEGSDA